MSIMQGDFLEVKLTRGLVTIIDAEDLELVSQWKWFASRGGNTDYALRKKRIDGRQQTVVLHRVLLNAPAGMHVDHINGNGLDNRRENLRLCTRRENRRNSQRQAGSVSQFKGVSKRQGRPKAWVAKIYVGEKQYTQCFFTELEAAKRYDEMAREHFGEFAKLNFPQTEDQH